MIVGESHVAKALSEKLFESGVYALPIVFPMVARDKARIRTMMEHRMGMVSSVGKASSSHRERGERRGLSDLPRSRSLRRLRSDPLSRREAAFDLRAGDGRDPRGEDLPGLLGPGPEDGREGLPSSSSNEVPPPLLRGGGDLDRAGRPLVLPRGWLLPSLAIV